jgi:glycosyltransferase involved in cell wall biosynthesis
MRRPILSILIPTRNRANYLRYAIKSALEIPSSDIEIIVSENYSQDNSWDVCKEFADSRLVIGRPGRPLAMHLNWEYLLNQASGEWVYFLGDDDAMMPHVAEYLRYISEKYPACEALVTPRAYYFWRGDSRGQIVSAYFDDSEFWVDSKAFLKRLLDGEDNYLNGPQFYAGGYHRRSLIRRVLAIQNGVYFKSVTPDAYSAAMGCIHTASYLRVGMPCSWVGTSDFRANSLGSSKDRKQDFWGLLGDDDLVMHRSIGDLNFFYTLPLVFYEAYISAIPVASHYELNRDRLRTLLLNAAGSVEAKNDPESFAKLVKCMGFSISDLSESVAQNSRKFAKIIGLVHKGTVGPIKSLFKFRSTGRQHSNWSKDVVSDSFEKYPNILSANTWASEAYFEWKSLVKNSESPRDS